MALSTPPAGVRSDAVLEAIRSVRGQLAVGGFAADRDHADPAANFEVLRDVGAAALLAPAEFGGTWDAGAGFFAGWGAFVRAVAEVCAGDGPTGQNWMVTGLVARTVCANPLVPEQTRRAVAERVLHDGLRMVVSNAETSGAGPVVARQAPGGVVVSGTKTFNSNSGGRGVADVGCLLDGVRHHALVELSHPDVELHGDWDNMGQRGTCSQTITYHDVFVADGWHFPAATPSPLLFGSLMMLHGAVQQGIGEGALDAAVAHVRGLARATMAPFETAARDPLVLRRIGAMSSRLAASRALLFESADRVEAVGTRVDAVGAGGEAATVAGYRAKVAALDASLEAAGMVHELTGARSTANAHGLDRFWRNARTFASHDSVDAKNVYIGSYEVTGQLPDTGAFARL